MKIAVVGAGISGLGAAWLLAKQHEVHLFEADSRLGGHANTVSVTESDSAGAPGPTVAMDTGFLVYNELTYPNLCAFFSALEVETVDSNMSLSVQVQDKNLEWNGTNLNGVFGQRTNLFNFSFHRMLLEILRFGKEAEENVRAARENSWSLNDLLKARGYSNNFKQDYLIPIGAAIWSTPESKMLQFPAETFLQFFINHKLLQVNNRPVWRTVKNGSINYVNKVARALAHVHLNSAVLSVERLTNKIIVRTAQGSADFDKVVLATHTPITNTILLNKSEMEHQVLSSIGYEPNRTVLHKDVAVMPKNKRCWAAWNVNGTLTQKQQRKVSLSYYLNLLQPLQTQVNYFVTLNTTSVLQNTLQEFNYSHPQFDHLAIRAQNNLPMIQGNGGVYFAGAWSRYGFHEDGLLSAVKVAEYLGIYPPWNSQGAK